MLSSSETLYNRLIDSWNSRDAAAFANCFSEMSICVGFDGSDMRTRSDIQEQLGKIFSNHPTARYVTIIREVRKISTDVYLLLAHVGMVPPGEVKIDESKDAVQVMIAVQDKIVLFQNTPCRYDGREQVRHELTEELQSQLISPDL
jgi:uncharacterized protein (TIGR02246 family)